MKICLDAGHFGNYNRSPVVPDYYEAKRMWLLARKLDKALSERKITVTHTRTDQMQDLPLLLRGQKSRGCDLFLSLHSNAAGREDADHVVIFCPVQRENDTMHRISMELAKRLAPAITEVMGVKEKNYRIACLKSENDRDDNGKLDDDYYGVLQGAASVGTPALIIEHSFHTNFRAATWLMDDDNLEKLAVAIADIVADFFGVKQPIFRVQVGAYLLRANAVRMLQKLQASGNRGFITHSDGYYRVQAGAFTYQKNAEALAQTLKQKGFLTIIKRQD